MYLYPKQGTHGVFKLHTKIKEKTLSLGVVGGLGWLLVCLFPFWSICSSPLDRWPPPLEGRPPPHLVHHHRQGSLGLRCLSGLGRNPC